MKVERLVGTVWVVYDDEKGVIIDGAKKLNEKMLLCKVKKLGVKIEYILLTHTHYDHTGCVEALRKATGAKVVVGKQEAQCLRDGHTNVPKGTNAFSRMIGNAGHNSAPKAVEFYSPVTQDIIEISEKTTIELDGMDITAMPLGAHSVGSVGYKIGDHFFAGDVVFGIAHIVYPLFADFEDDIEPAWDKVINCGAKHIYPGHGRRLTMEYFKKKCSKRFG